MVSNYSACIDHRNQQPLETIINHEIPVTPWTKVAADIFHLHGKTYQNIIDYTMRYFDVHKIKNSQSATIIKKQIKVSSSKLEIPQFLVSDNGPEFKSTEFETFAKERDFKHITTSPNNPQSNGMVESNIQTIKKNTEKAIKTNQDPYLALLALRVTHIEYTFI